MNGKHRDGRRRKHRPGLQRWVVDRLSRYPIHGTALGRQTRHPAPSGNDDGGTPFTDPNLSTGDPIKAVHFDELRARINALRMANELSLFVFTDPVLSVGVTVMRATHLLELRTALNEAYVTAGQTVPTYTDSAIVVQSTLIKVAHILELRAAVVALEGS